MVIRRGWVEEYLHVGCLVEMGGRDRAALDRRERLELLVKQQVRLAEMRSVLRDNPVLPVEQGVVGVQAEPEVRAVPEPQQRQLLADLEIILLP